MSDIVEIARFSSDFEARTVLARLNADGIDAKIVTDNAGGAFPSLTMLGGGVRLFVRSEDAEAEATVLDGLNGDDAG